MASAAPDNSSVSESDVDQEEFDKIYDRIVNEQKEIVNKQEESDVRDSEITNDGPNIRKNVDVRDHTGLKLDESDKPDVKIRKTGGNVKFQTGTVLNNDGTIHGDIHAESKYNVEFHCCDKKKNKIYMIISAVIIVVVVILVVILQNL